MQIAAIANGHGLELASHGGSATNLNMLLAMPNAIYMESSGKQKMVNGEVLALEARDEQRSHGRLHRQAQG